MTTHLEEEIIAFGDKYRELYDSDRYRDGYRDGYWEGPCRDMDLYGGRDSCDDRGSRDYDQGYDYRLGSGRRAFGSGYRRDDDYRRGRDCYEDQYDRRDDRGTITLGTIISVMTEVPPKKPKLNLKPRSTSKEDDSSASTSQSSRATSIFGGAKPVDTAAREREVYRRSRRSCSVSWMSQNWTASPGRDTQVGEVKKLRKENS